MRDDNADLDMLQVLDGKLDRLTQRVEQMDIHLRGSGDGNTHGLATRIKMIENEIEDVKAFKRWTWASLGTGILAVLGWAFAVKQSSAHVPDEKPDKPAIKKPAKEAPKQP